MADRPTELGRRAFLSRLASALAAFLAAAVGLPLAGAAAAPGMRREEAVWIKVGSTAEFQVGQPRLVTYGFTKTDGYLQAAVSRSVWVSKLAGDRFTVYNAACTHLGCLVNYRPNSRTFLSPCHGGVFALEDGAVLDGPPPRPLDQLNWRIEEGTLLVQQQDFLLGIPEKVAL